MFEVVRRSAWLAKLTPAPVGGCHCVPLVASFRPVTWAGAGRIGKGTGVTVCLLAMSRYGPRARTEGASDTLVRPLSWPRAGFSTLPPCLRDTATEGNVRE